MNESISTPPPTDIQLPESIFEEAIFDPPSDSYGFADIVNIASVSSLSKLTYFLNFY